MDPNACWARLRTALVDEDWTEAAQAADDLWTWLGRQGATPGGLPGHVWSGTLMEFCNAVRRFAGGKGGSI